MDWKIPAAALAALGVLGGGTLLAAQVQSDLDAGVDQRIEDTKFERPEDSPPLKLNDFKLPGNVPFDIPKGAEISPDLSELKLPEDLDIKLPDDLDLSGLDFKLPEDFKLDLPPGTIFSPPGLELPEGGEITLPDGSKFKLPPGSKLDLPPEVVDRLLRQGLPTGALPQGRSFDLNGLSPDLHATLTPPKFDGGGTLKLPKGTLIQLPDGQTFPFAAGALAYAARHVLPAGTTFDIPFDATTGGGTFPVPQPRSKEQLIREGPGGSGGPLVAVETEITSMPARVRKGEPVTVGGYVRELHSRRPVAGAPVDVFMNETKRTPGVLVGQAVSDAGGNWRATVTFPSDKPARDYQLVNHAVAFEGADGRSYGDGWGDPPFSTFAATTISLVVPRTDGFGAGTPISGTLKDHTGAPVPGVTVVLSSGASTLGRPVTDSEGRFGIQASLARGTHVIEARFNGNQYYESSNVERATITIESFAIEIQPVLRGKPGDTFLFSGRTLGQGAVAPERAVRISGVFDAGELSLLSDSTGRFSYAYATSPNVAPGRYTLTYSMPEHNVVKTQIVEINATATLTLTAPLQWDVEEPMPVSARLVSQSGTPVAGQLVRLTLTGPPGTRTETLPTNARGEISTTILALRPERGDYTLRASVLDNPHLTTNTPSQRISLATFTVEWAIPETVVRGAEVSGAVTVRFAGAPYAGAAIRLDFFGSRELTTDGVGRATWTHRVSEDAPLGLVNVTLKTLDHPQRNARVNVVALPKIELEAPSEFMVGQPLEAALRLVDDKGAPLARSRVQLVAIGPHGIARTNVTTDDEGRWRGPVEVAPDAGNLTLSARFDAAGPYLATDSVRTLSQTTIPMSPVQRFGWLLPVVGAVVAAGAGGAWYWTRKRARPAAEPVQEVAPVVGPGAPDFVISFGIPADEPRVWGVGDPLLLAVHNDGAAGEFDISWTGGSTRVSLAGGSESRTSLTFPEEGEIALTARRVGATMEPAHASVRIVDYRKETAREFDLFLEKARAVDSSLTRQSTPREIAWTLEGRLGRAAQKPLDEIALVMEVTNYSHYTVSRDHYLRFVAASRVLDRLLAAPAPQGG